MEVKILQEIIKKSEEMYKIAALNGSKGALVYLANLYHDGSENNKLNAKKALYYYGLAVKKGYIECLLDIGDIYLWGLSDVNEDKVMARKCYSLLSKLGNNDLKLQAIDRLRQLNDEDENVNSHFDHISENDSLVNRMFTNTYTHPQPNFALNEIKSQNNILSNNLNPTLSPTNFNLNDIKLYDIDDLNINLVDNIDREIRNRLQVQEDNEIPIIPIIPLNTNRIRNDHQNVHDHVVNKTLKKSINKLKDTTNIYINDSKSLIDIRNLINNEKS